MVGEVSPAEIPSKAEIVAMVRRSVHSLACAAMLVLACAPVAAETARIGLANPFSGPLAASGERNRMAARLAVQTLNAEGGLLGREVELVAVDDRCGADEAAAAALELVKAGVSLVVGHLCSHASLVAAAVYEAVMVPMITPSSTHPRLTEEGRRNVFRLGGRDDDQGRLVGDWLAAQPAAGRVALVHDGSTYGRGLANRVRARLRELGVTELLFAPYTPGAADYAPLVAKLAQAGPELLFVGGYGPDAGRILRTARDAGLQLRMVGGDGLVGEEFWTAAGPAANDTVFTGRPDLRGAPAARNVLAAFRALGLGDLPSGLGTYAAVEVWAAAARRAGTLDPATLADTIHRGRFATVIGPVAFDQKGDLVGAAWQWFAWRDGDYRPLDREVARRMPRPLDRKAANP